MPAIDIQPITPALSNAYFSLFDHAFSDNPRWAGCYCAFYDDPIADDQWDASDEEFALRNRANRADTIARGEAHGLLAFVDSKPVGWVNAGPRNSYGNLRIFARAVGPGDPAIGSVMCFVIHPEHRTQGVATALLGAVDDYFRDLGLFVAEAYPRREPPANPGFPWSAAYYKGTPEMYRKLGYLPHREFERFTAVRKTLE